MVFPNHLRTIWPSRKESPTLDSGIIKVSILSLIISANESNLFGIENKAIKIRLKEG